MRRRSASRAGNQTFPRSAVTANCSVRLLIRHIQSYIKCLLCVTSIHQAIILSSTTLSLTMLCSPTSVTPTIYYTNSHILLHTFPRTHPPPLHNTFRHKAHLFFTHHRLNIVVAPQPPSPPPPPQLLDGLYAI